MKHAVTLIVTCLAIACLCWLSMQLVHELGHVCGAWLTGGRVTQVILHPTAISRTDVAPNPAPGVVAWCGPIFGCLLPLLIHVVYRTQSRRQAGQEEAKTRWPRIDVLSGFFAGFCLIANGAYLLFGTPDRVGDCGDLLNAGTPAWGLYLFGVSAITAGMYCWHRLGSIRSFLSSPQRTAQEAAVLLSATLLLVAGELWWAGW